MYTIIIDTDNAAFEGNAGAEVARILRVLAEKVDDGLNNVSLYDINGNKVGRAEHS